MLKIPISLNKERKELLEKFRKIENERSNPSIKKFFQRAKDFWKNQLMTLDQIIPALALISILILILPSFIKSNINNKLFLKNLSIWGIIVLVLMILLFLIF